MGYRERLYKDYGESFGMINATISAGDRVKEIS